MNYDKAFRNQAKVSAILIIQPFARLQYSDEVSIISKQIVRAVIFAAANYRAAGRTRSEKKDMQSSTLL